MDMKQLKQTILAASVLSFSLVACEKYESPVQPGNNTSVVVAKTTNKPEIFRAFGTAADITVGLDQYRAAIGGALNTAPGAIGGRREVNWDGIPTDLTNNDLFPGNFFAQIDPALPNGRKRGITFLNFSGFRISNNNFADIDPSYADEFATFSPSRTFMPAGSNFTEVQFKVPGTNTAAYVESFGVIFSDVEKGNSATIELFDDNYESIGVFMAHPQTGKGKFSFLAIRIPGAKIAKVVIKSGEVPLGDKDISAGGMYDLVTMDDFIYDEPKALQ
jgi:hypothetical protein